MDNSSVDNFIVPAFSGGGRIDILITKLCKNITRSQFQKLVKANFVKLNGEIISKYNIIAKENDVISINSHERENFKGKEQNSDIKKLEIIYEDDDVLLINKPINLTVHEGCGGYDDTLSNLLLRYFPSIADVGESHRPGIVHRLDRDTSGIMLIAKNNISYKNLYDQIANRQVTRKYKALVFGTIIPSNGVINLPIGRDVVNYKKISTRSNSAKEAKTHYSTIEKYRDGMFSLVECSLETGRTHQIRVHLSSIGHSILGDQQYGHNKRKINKLSENNLKEFLFNFNHQALHAYCLIFIHPKTNQCMEFTIDLPSDYINLIEKLRV